MTISSETFRFRYVSTGGTTYPYTNKILDEDDLAVYIDDVLQTISTHYTVSGVGETGGGNVVFLVAPAAGADVLLTKDGVSFTQETDYTENDEFPAASHEDALDKLTNLAQKIWDYVRRSVKVPITSTLTDLDLPTPVANRLIGWDATATGFANYAMTDLDQVIASALGASLVVSATATDARSLLDAQQLNDNLTALAGLTGAADKVPYFTAAGAMALADLPNIFNLKPVVNAATNKLDVFSKSGGAVPAAAHPIKVMIPDGNGFTQRTRAAAYLSGTGQIIMADGVNYWSKGSRDAEIKTAWLYAIWDANGGIVWALGGYSGYTIVPVSTTATDDDYFLLENGSTYTRAATDYCVAVCKIRYQYDTGDSPDHTIQASGRDIPQVIWTLISDYGYQKNFPTTATAGGDFAEAARQDAVVKQSGKYDIEVKNSGASGGTANFRYAYIKTGSSTYASAVYKATDGGFIDVASRPLSVQCRAKCYLNAGDTIHHGVAISDNAGNRTITGDDSAIGSTYLMFRRID